MTIITEQREDEEENPPPLFESEMLSKTRRIALFVEPSPFAFQVKWQILNRVMDRLPDARIALIEDCLYREELEKMFSTTPAVLAGMLQGEELPQVYACGDIFVMPSESETLGQVVMEAISSGLPVVACAGESEASSLKINRVKLGFSLILEI